MEISSSERVSGDREYHRKLLASYEDPENMGRLFRPLDTEDRLWMEQFGCEWPSPDEETTWLAKANDLMLIGSEKYTGTSDPQATISYQAREELLALMPDALEVWRRWIGYYDQGRNNAYVKPPIPSDGFVGRQRLIQDLGLKLTSAQDELLHRTRPGRILSVLNLLFRQYDIDGIALVNADSQAALILAFKDTTITEKFRVLTSFARASGQDSEASRRFAVSLVEESPTLLANRSAHLLRALGHLSFALFPHLKANPDATMAKHIAVGGGVHNIAAYLQYGAVIYTPRGLAQRAKYLRDNYEVTELRAFVASHVDRPVDPAMKAVLKAYKLANPFTVDERRSAIDSLPNLSTRRIVGSYKTETPGMTRGSFRHTLTAMPELGTKTALSLFDTIGAGLLIEEEPIDPSIYNADPMLERTVKDGRAARKQVVASFAGRLLVTPKDGSERYDEDAEQTELLHLTMAVINYAREFVASRPEDPPEDIEDVWSSLKERMDEIKLNTTFSEPVPEPYDNEEDPVTPVLVLPSQTRKKVASSMPGIPEDQMAALVNRFRRQA